jgi:hypothetical protein
VQGIVDAAEDEAAFARRFHEIAASFALEPQPVAPGPGDR